ncbi:MAG: SBBP repeat-containing protein, partial [Nitrospirae bacterium]|nr:SBBP repeat-containing protein [Nitrospirota bacterium]
MSNRTRVSRAVLIIVLLVMSFAGLGREARAELPYRTVWTRQMGFESSDQARCVAVDGVGNVYIAGYTSGGLYGDMHAGATDCYVIKYDSAGVRLWTRQLGSTTYDEANGIAVDGSGNVYVAGLTYGGLDGNTSFGEHDIFVVKYDSNGVKKWSRQLGTYQIDEAYGVAVDGTGSVYVAGRTFGSLHGNDNAGETDVFVVKYDADGVKKWTRQLGTDLYDEAYGIAADGFGNVYVAGHTSHGLDLNSNEGSNNIFVVKYNSAGDRLWTRRLGSDTYDTAHSVDVDNSGNVYVAGETSGGFDGNTFAGDRDFFVVKYDGDGLKQWSRQLGTAYTDEALGVAVDGSGNAYVTGFTDGSFDGYPNPTGWTPDIVVVKYDSDGVKKWTRQLGTSGLDIAYGITVDASGSVYLAGSTSGAMDKNLREGSGCDSILLNLAESDPYSTITSPAAFKIVDGEAYDITGTSDGSNGISFVEVSTDGGVSWQTASGTNPWSFLWSLPSSGTYKILSRSTDSLSEMETPAEGVRVAISSYFTCNASVIPAYAGSVEFSPSHPDNIYFVEDEVWLTASAVPGYRFTGWSGDVNSTSNPILVIMDAAKSIIANFVEFAGYELDALVDHPGRGHIEYSPWHPDNIYQDGEDVWLTVTQNMNYAFSGWSGDATGTANPLLVTMHANTTVTANTVNEGRPGYAEVHAAGPGGYIDWPAGAIPNMYD